VNVSTTAGALGRWVSKQHRKVKNTHNWPVIDARNWKALDSVSIHKYKIMNFWSVIVDLLCESRCELQWQISI
jgi:hypothetical protein